MHFDESTNRLKRELAAQGIRFNSDERTNRLVQELAAEKQAQTERVKVVLKPVIFVVAVVVFIICFWRYDLGLLLSIAAAVVSVPALGLVAALPIGYVLGKRAARLFKSRLRDNAR
jgi:hypothetical protein